MIWNAVAAQAGRVFVAGPRWAGASGPMRLGELDGTRDGAGPRPYPDEAWNGWAPGADPAHAFVNINSLRLDELGGLWVVDTGAPTSVATRCRAAPNSSGSTSRPTRSAA